MSYAKTLGDPQTFQTIITALSDIDCHAKHGLKEDTFQHAVSTTTKKQLRTLDSLALLLIFEGKGEVAATSLRRTATSIEILWAKNDPSPPTSAQRHYLNSLIESFQRLDAPSQTLSLIIGSCKRKIVRRIGKVAQFFREQATEHPENVFGIDDTTVAYHRLQQRLRTFGLIREDHQLVQALNRFYDLVAGVTAASNVNTIGWTLVFAYRISDSPDSISQVITPYQFHRI